MLWGLIHCPGGAFVVWRNKSMHCGKICCSFLGLSIKPCRILFAFAWPFPATEEQFFSCPWKHQCQTRFLLFCRDLVKYKAELISHCQEAIVSSSYIFVTGSHLEIKIQAPDLEHPLAWGCLALKAISAAAVKYCKQSPIWSTGCKFLCTAQSPIFLCSLL